MWISVKDQLPQDTCEVLVSNGEDGCFAVAWYHPKAKIWYVSTELLEASNYDGRATIELSEGIKYWKPIEDLTA
jgi:hypothetical protein